LPFSKLKDEEIDEFLGISEIKTYKNGENLYAIGDPPDYFYFILQGRVLALIKEAKLDREIELLKRGTSFGIISLFNEEPHSVTARSIEVSTVLRTPKDKFKNFLNLHPHISFEFYQLLSQRIRSRTGPKKIFQCKRIGILGASGSGKTTYMYHLASHLKEQTKKKAVCLELSFENNFKFPTQVNRKILHLNDLREDNINEHITHDNIDYLAVNAGSSYNFVSLLNFLSESYHFIIYEIPCEVLGELADDFILPAGYFHFLICIKYEEIVKSSAILGKLREKTGFDSSKFSIVLNEFGKKEEISFTQIREIINQPIYANLPLATSPDYPKALRRIARELAEVVVGLALGSGAAYGFSHVGVLKVLEENNIYVDIICGSSIGAVIAALWALGYEAIEIEKLTVGIGKKMNLFSLSGISFPFKGFLKAKYLENILKRIFKDKTFYNLKRTLKIVVFDFVKRETIVIGEGLLYKAVAASCAMPGVFEPVKVGNEILLDGGILSPLPVKVLLNHGANKIIAVNITPSRQEIYAQYQRQRKWHIFDFIFGSIETMQREFVKEAVMVSDMVIHPNFEGLGWLEFDQVEEFIKRGQQATLKSLEEIKKLTHSQ
jgi:NTE family protein